MAHHFLPRQLLRGFCHDEQIWAYEKTAGKEPFRTGVERVAAERDMYTQELENRLNLEVELPFNAILPVFQHRGGLSPQDRLAVARYLLTMVRRTPEGREFSKAAAIPVAKAVRQEALDGIAAMGSLSPELRDLANKATINIENIFAKIATEDGRDLWLSTVLPDNYPRMMAVIAAMNWTVLTLVQGQLLISDVPMYYDKANGLKPPDGELTFPLSSTQLLVANWRGPFTSHITYAAMRRGQVREWNRRSVMNARRWIYFKQIEDWMIPFFNKAHTPSRRII
jgi:hypothetical protein